MPVTLKKKKPLDLPDAVRPKPVEDEYTPQVVTQLIDEAKKNPMSRAELRAENARLMAYGARQAKKVGIKERDIPRVIHESRSRRRTP